VKLLYDLPAKQPRQIQGKPEHLMLV